MCHQHQVDLLGRDLPGNDTESVGSQTSVEETYSVGNQTSIEGAVWPDPFHSNTPIILGSPSFLAVLEHPALNRERGEDWRNRMRALLTSATAKCY